MCDREDSRREKHSMIKQAWKHLYIDTWKSLPVLKKISVCFGTPVITIAPIVLIILCLLNRFDKTALPVALGMLGILPFTVLFSWEAARSRVYKIKPQTWRYALAFIAYVGIVMGVTTILAPPAGLEGPKGVGSVIILISAYFLLPLIVYLLRGGQPSQKVRARWWQTLLLILGVFFMMVFSIMLALVFVVPEMRAEMFQKPVAMIALGLILLILGIILMLPYLLRKSKTEEPSSNAP